MERTDYFPPQDRGRRNRQELWHPGSAPGRRSQTGARSREGNPEQSRIVRTHPGRPNAQFIPSAGPGKTAKSSASTPTRFIPIKALVVKRTGLPVLKKSEIEKMSVEERL